MNVKFIYNFKNFYYIIDFNFNSYFIEVLFKFEIFVNYFIIISIILTVIILFYLLEEYYWGLYRENDL